MGTHLVRSQSLRATSLCLKIDHSRSQSLTTCTYFSTNHDLWSGLAAVALKSKGTQKDTKRWCAYMICGGFGAFYHDWFAFSKILQVALDVLKNYYVYIWNYTHLWWWNHPKIFLEWYFLMPPYLLFGVSIMMLSFQLCVQLTKNFSMIRASSLRTYSPLMSAKSRPIMDVTKVMERRQKLNKHRKNFHMKHLCEAFLKLFY